MIGRVLFTLVITVVAAVVGWQTWDYYMNEPWTRDGHVRADVIGITPDVSGIVNEVLVADNQTVKKGDVLLRIDRERFALALQLAEAAAKGQAASLEQARREYDRYQQLSRNVASQQNVEQAGAAQAVAEASYEQAVTNRDLAKLNLQRSEIRAPVNGVITNLSLNAGDYATAGKAVIALVDSDSLRVEGYFEETKLPRIAIGDPVDIAVMG
ncbi:MAG: HlyD family secretion protein, partial [Hyphomicrobiales bacterium]